MPPYSLGMVWPICHQDFKFKILRFYFLPVLCGDDTQVVAPSSQWDNQAHYAHTIASREDPNRPKGFRDIPSWK